MLFRSGVAGILVLAELCRRCVGLPILVVVGALLVYTFVSMLNAGQTFQQVLSRVIYTLFFGTSGVLSTPVQVCAKFIAVFIIFGAFLERTGIAQFFINLKDNDFLNHRTSADPRGWGYAVFGKVTQGMDVVDKIARVQTGNQGYYENVPVSPVTIQSVKIISEK